MKKLGKTIFLNAKSCAGYTVEEMLMKASAQLKKEGKKVTNSNLREILANKFTTNKSKIDKVIRFKRGTITAEELVEEEIKEATNEKEEENADQGKKDFPRNKGQEYKDIKEKVKGILASYFKTKGFASEEELYDAVENALDSTNYRFLSSNVDDLTNDIIKTLKTKTVYSMDKE